MKITNFLKKIKDVVMYPPFGKPAPVKVRKAGKNRGRKPRSRK